MTKLGFLFVAAIAIVAVISIAIPVATTSVYAQDQRMISVSGDAVVSVEPDKANVFLGVDTQMDTALEAQTMNSQIMDNVIAAVRALGIDESDIQTTRFGMHPVNDWSAFDGQPRVIGYQVSNHINITVRNIDMVGTVISTATEAGANSASHISFAVSDTSEAYGRALAIAIADATGKANIVAQTLGVRLGEVQQVHEGSSMFGVPHLARSTDIWLDAHMAMTPGAGIPVQIGEMDIHARVQVSFAID